MNFCTSCGKELPAHQSFCTNCGQQREATTIKEEKTTPPPKKPMSKRAKWMWSISFIFIALLIGTHLTLSSIFDPMKAIQAMDEAVMEEDSEAFLDHVKLDEEAHLQEENFLRFLEETDWEYVKAQMIEPFQTDSSQSISAYKINDSYNEPIFSIHKKPVLLGMYDTYEFRAIPSRIVYETNHLPASLAIDGKKLEVGEEQIDGASVKAYPGEYTIEGGSSTEFGDVETSDTYTVSSLGDKGQNVFIEFPLAWQSFYTDKSNVSLVVNGEKMEKTLHEYEEEYGGIGPLPQGEGFEVQAEWTDDQGEVHHTDAVALSEETIHSSSMDLTFEKEEIVSDSIGDEDMDTLMDRAATHVLEFRDAYEMALNSIDYSIISAYLLSGSSAEEELREYVGGLEDEGFNYNFTDNEVLEVSTLVGNYYEVDTQEQFIFTNHEGETTEYDRFKTYYVVPEGKDFKIFKIEINETDRN